MNRFRAAAIHLLLSLILLSVAFLVMRLYLYPSFYFSANSGWGILVVVAGVDLIVGPFLTGVVYAPGKKSLKFDLTIIMLLQLVAFGYGAIAIYKERPMYAVFYIDAFEIVTAYELFQSNPDMTEFPDVSGTGVWPQVVYAAYPERGEPRRKYTREIKDGAPRIPQRFTSYRAIGEDNLPLIIQRGMSAESLLEAYDVPLASLEKENIMPERYHEVAFYPVYGKNINLVIALNRSTGGILSEVDKQ